MNRLTLQKCHLPFVRQPGKMDCGAACLAMVCKHYGMSVPLDRLRDMAGVTRDGASLAGLAEAAERLGFVTQGVRMRYERLVHKPLPAVAHWQGRHFIVLFRVTPETVWVADPALGIRKRSREAFEAGWSGVALLLMQPFAAPDV